MVEAVKLHPTIHLGGHPILHRKRRGNYTTSSDTNHVDDGRPSATRRANLWVARWASCQVEHGRLLRIRIRQRIPCAADLLIPIWPERQIRDSAWWGSNGPGSGGAFFCLHSPIQKTKLSLNRKARDHAFNHHHDNCGTSAVELRNRYPGNNGCPRNKHNAIGRAGSNVQWVFLFNDALCN